MSHTSALPREPDAQATKLDVSGLTWGELKGRYPGEFNCWRAMKQRAQHGVCTIHPDMRSLEGFLSTMGPMPKPNMTVDRIDNDRKEYAPDNVRWATKRTQSNNRSNTVILTDRNGVARPLTDWAKQTGQKPSTMRQRRFRGWSDIEIIEGQRDKGNAPPRGTGKAIWPVDEREQPAWEDAFQRFYRHYRKHPGLTRRVVLCWMAQNRARTYSAQLEKTYPDEWGEESNPEGELVEVLKDPRYKRWLNCQHNMQSTWAEIEKDRHERAMLAILMKRGDRPFNPWDIKM